MRACAIDTVLIDIDGVLTVSWQALPGAPAAVQRIRDAGLHLSFLTNTTSRSRASLALVLTDQGFDVHPDEILSAPVATAAYLRKNRPAPAACSSTAGTSALTFPVCH